MPTLTDPRFCNTVLDIRCQAPPEGDDGDGSSQTRATCFACGLPTCTSCSVRTRWYGYGRRRVCADCLQDVGRGQEAADLTWRHAGYTGQAPARIAELFSK